MNNYKFAIGAIQGSESLKIRCYCTYSANNIEDNYTKQATKFNYISLKGITLN